MEVRGASFIVWLGDGIRVQKEGNERIARSPTAVAKEEGSSRCGGVAGPCVNG
jgi:hypothetical protein